MSGTAMVMGSNLTRTCFFLNGDYFKTISAYYLSAHVFSA